MEEHQHSALIGILTADNSKQDRIAKVEKLIEKKIAGQTKFLLDQALELAAGIWIVKDGDPLQVKYYRKAPSMEAIIYLIDRLVGKPTVKTEDNRSKEKQGVAAVQNIIMNLAINNKTDGKPATEVIDVRPGQDAL